MSVKMRQEVERKIAVQCIADILSQGYSISVFDCEEFVLERSKDPDAIIGAMFTTDDDRLYVYHDEDPETAFGWVWFVYGNDGWDVISDYTTNLEEVLKKTNELAESYS